MPDALGAAAFQLEMHTVDPFVLGRQLFHESFLGDTATRPVQGLAGFSTLAADCLAVGSVGAGNGQQQSE
nr:hypothetical protein [Thiolapillus sp.]